MPVNDLTGQRFGRLRVVERAANDAYGNARWLCVCNCASNTIVAGYSLRSGNTQSCGCLGQERLRESMPYRKRRDPIHGMVGTPTYGSWQSMVQRCTNSNHEHYHLYGGRGIGICRRWRDSFAAFYADMGERLEGKPLGRRFNILGYYPQNCRWATKEEQMRNRRTSRFLVLNGATKTISEWSRELGVARKTISGRIERGWTVEKALTTAARRAVSG